MTIEGLLESDLPDDEFPEGTELHVGYGFENTPREQWTTKTVIKINGMWRWKSENEGYPYKSTKGN